MSKGIEWNEGMGYMAFQFAVRRYFDQLLQKTYGTAATVSSRLGPDGPDIELNVKGVGMAFLEFTVTAEAGPLPPLLPPSRFTDIMTQVEVCRGREIQRARQEHRLPQEAPWIVVTNYALNDIMITRLKASGVYPLTFTLEEMGNSIAGRLRNHIERVLGTAMAPGPQI